MSLIEKLENDSECIEVIYQHYILNKSLNEVFIFYEGKDDYKYYDIRISPFIVGKKYKHYICDGKKNVLSLHEMIENQTGDNSKKIILYFVDKDFDDNKHICKDIYITPTYAIENLYFTNEALKKIIMGELCFSAIDDDDDRLDFEYALGHIIEHRDTCIEDIIIANAWYYLQKNKYSGVGVPPRLYGIKEFKDIKNVKKIEILESKVENPIKVTAQEMSEAISYICCDPVNRVRGKYLEQSMASCFDEIFKDASKKKNRIGFVKRRKNCNYIVSENLLSVFSQYADVPACLVEYIKARVGWATLN